jgi:hypothetical protein
LRNEAPVVLTLSGRITLCQNVYLAEIVVPSARKIFKRCGNGSVLQNGVKHIIKVLFLSSKTVRLFPIKAIDYINIIHNTVHT